jgi:hypothetical protein
VRLAIFCARREASKTTDDRPATAGDEGWTTKAEAKEAHDATAAMDAIENFMIFLRLIYSLELDDIGFNDPEMYYETSTMNLRPQIHQTS